MADAPALRLNSPAFMDDPMPALHAARAQGPLTRIRLPLVGTMWLTTTHAGAQTVLKSRDRSLMRNPESGRLAGLQWWMPRFLRRLAINMLAQDEPEHRRLRKLVDQAFRRQVVADLRPSIARTADDLLDRLPTDRPIDLMDGLCRRLPLLVICQLLGLPEQDHDRFAKLAAPLSAMRGRLSFLKAVWSIRPLTSYLEEQIETLRRTPRPGLLSELVHAEEDGDRLDRDELLAMAFLLLLAGHETTTHLIAVGTVTLLRHPEQMGWLTADWARAPVAVEELLRHGSVVQLTKPRHVAADTEIEGAALPAGSQVMACLAAANCDPAVFADPDALRLDRDPNPHLAFGSGIHLCLGMQLARAEAAVAFERLLTRFPRLSLAEPDAPLDWTGRLGMRSLRRLPVRLEP